jgi:hypothetical protein
MAVSNSVQSSFWNPLRTSGEHFDTESEANQCKLDAKAAGKRNVRVAKFLDHTRRDGTKVYGWVVRWNA